MSVITTIRATTHEETAAEMDRRGEVIEKLEARIAELEAENDRFRKALTELTTLGNGERLGNSDGNMIARRALGL